MTKGFKNIPTLNGYARMWALLSGPPISLLGQVAYLVSSYRFFYIEANRTTNISTFGICARPALSTTLFLLVTVDNRPVQLFLCVTSRVRTGALLSTIRAAMAWGRACKFTTFDLVIPIMV
jgi:hypothetical protein